MLRCKVQDCRIYRRSVRYHEPENHSLGVGIFRLDGKDCEFSERRELVRSEDVSDFEPPSPAPRLVSVPVDLSESDRVALRISPVVLADLRVFLPVPDVVEELVG